MLAGLWGVPFFEAAYKLPNAIAAGKMSFMFIGFAIGGPILGWVSDHLGKRKPLIYIGTLIMLSTLIVIIYFSNLISPTLLGFLMLLFGIGMGGFLISFSMIREVNKLVLAGTALGFMNMFNSLWEAVSEPFIGKLLDLGWQGQLADNGARLFTVDSYHRALFILPLYFILGLLCLYFVKETHGEQQI